MIRLSAFADEADGNFSGQISALIRNEIEHIELRGLDGKNISKISETEAKEYAKMLADSHISVWSIGSPIGKVSIDSDMEEHRESLRHICRLANIFGTDRVRIFSFYDAHGKADFVIEELSELVNIAKEFGVKLCHENEEAIFGDTLDRIMLLKDKVAGLNFIYDPANFLLCGESADRTLNALVKDSDYFHIKDAIKDTREIVPAGYGDGMIEKLVSMLPWDRDITLTIEPHLAVFSGYSDISHCEMKNKFKFSDNNEAFDTAADSLKKILEIQGYKKIGGGYEMK